MKPEQINHDRRRYLSATVKSVAAAELTTIGSAAQPETTQRKKMAAIRPGTNTSFASLRHIDAGVLNVGYAEAGPADAPAVILLHGWPYDIHSYVDVAPLLASAGYRVLIPYVRGYGSTRFLSGETFRNGQPSVLAVDTIAFMDALGIKTAILAGFDSGARTANITAALWPERCKAMVSVSGYLIGSPGSRQDPVAPEGRASMVVPVLLCHRTRPGGLRQIPERLCEANLADRIAEVELR